MKIYLSIIGVLFSVLLIGQNDFSLQQAKEFAVENNEKIINANLDLKKAERKVWETTAIGLPQVSASAEFQNFLDIPTTVLPAKTFNPMAPDDAVAELKFGTDYTAKGAINVSQIIFNGNYLVGLQASKAYTNTSRKLIEKSKHEVKYAVSEAYYTVLVLQENISVLKESLEKMKKLQRETQILVDEKVIESTSILQLDLSVLQIQTGIAEIEHQVDVAKILLKFQMGYDLDKSITLTDSMDDFLNESKVYSIINSFDAGNHIDHQVLETQLKLNELNLKNKKAAYLPSLAGYLSLSKSAQRYKFNFFDSEKSWYPTTLWGLNLDIPIFSSGKRKSVIDQAELELIKTQNSISQLDRGLQLQMQKANAEFFSAKEIYKTQLKAVDIAQEVLDKTTVKFKESVVNSLELTQTQTQYIQTQAELTKGIFNLIKAKLTIDNLLNKL